LKGQGSADFRTGVPADLPTGIRALNNEAEAPPPGITRVAEGAGIVIRHRWLSDRTPWHFPKSVIAALIWNGLVGYFLWKEQQLFPGLFTGGHKLLAAAVGFILGYLAVATLINATTLEWRDNVLRVRTGPLPWRPERVFRREEVIQVRFQDIPVQLTKSGASTRPFFNIGLTLRSGRRVTIFWHLRRIEQASCLLRRLCTWFQLPDTIEQKW
jgi:hypothetical protein